MYKGTSNRRDRTLHRSPDHRQQCVESQPGSEEGLRESKDYRDEGHKIEIHRAFEQVNIPQKIIATH